MGLKAQLPFWISLTRVDSETGVEVRKWSIHRLDEEIFEVQMLVHAEVLMSLRNDDFDFVSFLDDQFGSHLWTDANPVDTRRNR